MERISKFLLSEKIPTIVCATACMVSVLVGFVMGHIFFGAGGNTLAYADTSAVYQSDTPYFAAVQPQAYDLPTQYYAPAYNQPAPDEELPAHLYVVTTLDGYLVVYHADKHGGGIKEMTSTFVGALTPEELERLAAGIRIYSDEALARILQDYGS